MDNLFPELLLEVSKYLNPKQIILLKQVCKRFNTDELLIYRNNLHYPRKYAKVFKIDRYHGTLSNYIITEENIKRILYDFYVKERDIVRGDIIEFYMLGATGTSKDVEKQKENDDYFYVNTEPKIPSNIAIFDGKTFIPFHASMGSYYYHNVTRYNMIWLDNQQCINHVTYGCLYGDYVIYTKIHYNDVIYYLIYDLAKKLDFLHQNNISIISTLMNNFCLQLNSNKKNFYTKSTNYNITDKDVFFMRYHKMTIVKSIKIAM